MKRGATYDFLLILKVAAEAPIKSLGFRKMLKRWRLVVKLKVNVPRRGVETVAHAEDPSVRTMLMARLMEYFEFST